ncbi:MAG: DUF4386 domain-containing protein [Anaerolineae bacterium]
MADKRSMDSPNRLARMTGVLYLLVVLCGIISEILVKNVVFVPGDMAATVSQITIYGFIFRLGFVVMLARLVFLTLLVLALYKLFGQVNRDVAAAMVAFGLVSVAVSMVALVFEFSAPLLLTSSDYSTLLTTDQWLAQVQFFINMQVHADKAAQILSLWVILLGFLMFKSGYFPKLLGILMMVAGVGYMAEFLVFFLLPQLDVQIAGVAFLAEVAFPFWLLIKGVNVEQWKSRALDPA